MATTDLDINIRLRDAASKGIGTIGAGLTTMGGAAGTAAKGLASMLVPLAAVVASVKIFTTTINTVKNSLLLFADFDDAMRTTAAVTKATGEEFKQLTALAKEMGQTTRYTATNAAQAMTFLGMAGFNATEIISALPDVLNLAAAGALELGDAADIATNILSGFGLQTEDLARANDVLVEAFTNSNTTLYELGEGFKYVGPIAAGVGANFEDLIAALGRLGDAGIKGCYDDKTDVLTLDGWKHWSDVSLEDKFATYCEDKNVIEYQKASRLIRYHHNGKMYKVQNRGINLCVTPDHRMFVKPRGKKDFEVLRAEQIVGKSVRYLTGGMEWEGKTPLLYKVNGFLQDRGNWDKTITAKYIHPDIWAAFMGWYISEGSINEYQGDYKITIAQIKSDHLDEIKKILDQLPWKFNYFKNIGFQCCSQQLFKELEPLGKQLDRYIPQYLKNWGTPQLEKLYDALIKGDGDQNSTYYTSSLKLKDDFQEIALKLGYATFSKIRHEKNSQVWFNPEDRYIRANADGWKINVASRRINPWWENSNYTGVHGDRLDYSRHDIFEGWIDYDGEVFCAEVPNHLLIVRREGRVIVSGNSLAGTTLRGVIDALFNPTNDEAKLMDELSQRIGGAGLQIKNTNGQFIGFLEIIKQLETAGLRGEEALRLFGARAGPGMAALLNIGSKSLEQLNTQLNTVDDTARKLAIAQEAGLGGALRRIASAAEAVKIQLGEAFSKELADTTRRIIDYFSTLSRIIKDLESSGVIKLIGDQLDDLTRSITGFLDFSIAYIQEISNTFSLAYNLITLNSEGIEESLNKIGEAFRSVLQSREILGSDSQIQVDLLNKQIQLLEHEIGVKKQLIEQDKEDINGWRAKILGAKTYQEQLKRHTEEVLNLQAELEKLNQTKAEINIEISAEQALADFKKTGDYLEKYMSEAASERGPIGRGSAKIKKALEDPYKTVTLDSALNAQLIRLNAVLEFERAKLDAYYKEDLTSISAYYQERRAIVSRGIQAEIEQYDLRLKDASTTNDEMIVFEAKRFAKEKELETELTRLRTEEYNKRKALIQQQEADFDTLARLEIQRINAFREQSTRLQLNKAFDYEKQNQNELDVLRTKHQNELDAIRDYWDARIEIAREKSGDEIAISQLAANRQAEIDKQVKLQIKENDNVFLNNLERTAEFRLKTMADFARGIKDVFNDLYKATGEKNKALFYAAKGAAIAEATINIALGITKALAQGGIYGIAQAALVAAKGAAQIALITSQSYAEGGIIQGKSPTAKSDDKVVRVTSGEYVQPVSSVKYYGVDAMNAIRAKALPRDFFREVKNFRAPSMRFRSGYADGGQIGSVQNAFNVSVPVTVNGDITSRLKSRLQSEIESTVIRVMRGEMV